MLLLQSLQLGSVSETHTQKMSGKWCRRRVRKKKGVVKAVHLQNYEIARMWIEVNKKKEKGEIQGHYFFQT